MRIWTARVRFNISEFVVCADYSTIVSGSIKTSTNVSTSVEMTFTPRGDSGSGSTHKCTTGDFSFSIDSPALWSPDSPNLYDITIKVGKDEVKSYTGFRTVSRGVIDGVERPLLNGEFIFFFGTLDQGFWPDGIYTPPNYEAMVYDLKTLKKIGYNGLRKHVR
jgi:beta-galactosidase/beta-glucuronidase